MIDLLNKSTAWQQAWQAYLIDQLNSGHYLSYQQTALFWVMLFPQKQETDILASHILKHYSSTDITARRNAERFVASISTDLGYLGYLGYLILKKEIAEQAEQSISFNDLLRGIDLLTILLGRILQIQESGGSGAIVDLEIQKYIQRANTSFISTGDDEVKEAALDILRYLPVRSAGEIRTVLQLAESATDEKVQRAYVASLSRARPEKDDAWKELETGRRSQVNEVRKTIEDVFRRREKE